VEQRIGGLRAKLPLVRVAKNSLLVGPLLTDG
jgi:hypothetical protein